MSVIIKIILKILMKRMRNKLKPEISKTQCGFVGDSGTRNAIFILRNLCEKTIEINQDMYLCFIDYSKAFDKVKHDKLIDILQSLDIDGKDIRIIRNLYWKQTAAIKINDHLIYLTFIVKIY